MLYNRLMVDSVVVNHIDFEGCHNHRLNYLVIGRTWCVGRSRTQWGWVRTRGRFWSSLGGGEEEARPSGVVAAS